MPMKEHTYSVLLISASEKFNNSFSAMLPHKYYSPVHIVQSISHARQILADSSYDMVIINAPLPDDFGKKLAIDTCLKKNTVVLLLVKHEFYDETFAQVSEHGVLTLRKPTSAAILSQTLDWMCSYRERLRKMEKQTLSLEDKMTEIRIVNRAKWILIENCKMTETDAHKHLEKQAMDSCCTKREIAECILKKYS